MGAEQAPLSIAVDDAAAGQRVDRFVAGNVPDISRSFAQQLIADGHIRINGQPVKPSYLVQRGDQLTVTLPIAQPSDIVPEPIPLTIVYEDDDLLVVNKPAGMVVHPAPGHSSGTLVNALLYHYPTMQIGADLRPGIVHRLDRDTTGLLVIAKHDRAKTELQRQQQARTMLKIYLALIDGHFKEPEGVIDAPIDRHPVDRLRMAIVPTGRPSRTHYRCLEELGPYSLLEARLETGRTHQIRVHFAHRHHAVIGDTSYSPRRQQPALSLDRQFLHAYRLGFRRLDGEWVEFTAPLPPDLQSVLDKLRAQYGATSQRYNPDQPWWTETGS